MGRIGHRSGMNSFGAPPCVLNDVPVAGRDTLLDLFERWPRSTPSNPAVVSDDGRTLTYRELNRRANRLARALQAVGVRAESRVALDIEHGPDLLVGVLGVLKAAAAFVPLDPHQPADRAEAIMDDASARCVVVSASTAQRHAGDGRTRFVVDDLSECGEADDEAPPRELDEDNLAYVLFTSGSTGRAKGVLAPHRTLVRAFHAWNLVYRMDSDVRCSGQTAAFSFAVFHADWVRTLCSGGTLVVCRPSIVVSPRELLDVFDREHVQFTEMVPAVLRLFVSFCEDTGRKPRTLQLISVGSDRWYMREHRRANRVLAPVTRVVHTFGLTETTTDSAYYLTTDAERPDHALTPIGRPWANVRMYVLDSSLVAPPAADQPGQLCIGGELVTRGYLGQPRLTAERFVPDPWSADPGGRMYLTGDLARLLPSDDVEFLGRGDHQIKIRGARVEPGEVEGAIEAIDGVAQCIVGAHQGSDEELKLVAYVVARAGTVLSPTALWTAASTRLPPYMVPSAFVCLDALPLTRSGKIDRSALPPPSAADLPRATSIDPPRTADERIVAAIWSALLDIADVGINEDFFALGGTSLAATRMLARVEEALGTAMPLGAFFEEPTIASVASFVRAQRTHARSDAGSVESERPPRPRTLPLSREQLRLWLEYEADPESSAYNLVAAIRIDDVVDVASVQQALDRLAGRHETLRTIYEIDGGAPMQRVLPPAPVPLEVIEWRSSLDVESWFRQFATKPFDLARGPMLRALLARDPDSPAATLLIATHHIAADGPSLAIIERELKQQAPLPDPPQYVDYALLQDRQLRDGRLDRGLAFWRDYLEGCAGGVELPTDRTRRPGRGVRGASVGRRVPAAIRTALDRFCSEQAATPFAVIASIAGALACRLAGAPELLVGYPSTNRTGRELDSVVGNFANTLLLRVGTSPSDTLLQVLGRTRSAIAAALRHGDTPYDEIVRSLREHRRNAAPLVQVMVAMQEHVPAALAAAPATWSSDIGSARFDWTINIYRAGTELAFVWEYDASLFGQATMERHLGRLVALLERALADPGAPLATHSILLEQERSAFTALAGLDAPTSASRDAIARIYERVTSQPQCAALWHDGQVVTYAALWERVSAIMAALGEAPLEDRTVAIYLDRDVHLVAAILGVLGRGAAYMPLDPAYPADRVRAILQDAAPTAIITSTRRNSDLAAIAKDVPRLLVDTMAIVAGPLGAPDAGDGSRGAYVMFTSGSTGRPKGVIVTRGAVAALVDWMSCTFSSQELSGVIAATSVCFDLSVFELVGTLACGGRIVLVSDALAVAGLPAHADATLLNTVPSAAVELAAAGSLPPTLLTINVAGEALTGTSARRLATTGCRINNLYGPTETCVYSTAASIAPADDEPPIGRALPGEAAYVLDAALCPLPAGVEGDLYIGGRGVARGYVNSAALTAERFIPDPFSAEPGARMYRTGDRARWRHDGQLMFCGRRDNQIKVRGFRVELTEIEMELGRCAGVREAAVVAAGEGENRRLVAFVVAAPQADLPIDRVRSHLHARLPAYMVPTVIHVLDGLPRTASGKIDRRALPVSTVPRTTPWTAPQTATERWVAETWQHVLGIDGVSIADNLLDLGATSLGVIRFLARVRGEFGVTLSIAETLGAAGIGDLAARIDALRSFRPAAAPRPTADRARPIPLTFGQQGLWFSADQGRGPGLAVSVEMPLPPRIGTETLRLALRDVIARHEALRTRFITSDGIPFQQIGPAHAPPIEETHAAVTTSALMDALRQSLASTTFDPEQGVVARYVLLRTAHGDATLYAAFSHLVFDYWSMAVFGRDLAVACDARAAGGQPAWEPLAMQPADFAVRQHDEQRGDGLERRLDHWRATLDGAPPLLRLPDAVPDAAPSGAGAIRSFYFDAGVRDAVLDTARACGTTPYTTMLAAAAAAVAKMGGPRDVTFGCPVANRPGEEFEQVIGFFVDTTPVRLQIDAGAALGDVLAGVHRVFLDAVTNAVPYELLLRELRPPRPRGTTPIFQVLVTMPDEPAAGPMPHRPAAAADVPRAIPVRFELAMSIRIYADGVVLTCEYDRGVYDHAAIETVVDVIHRLLRRWPAQSNRSLATVALADAARPLEAPVTSTPVVPLAPMPVTDLLWRHCATQPDAEAVRWGQRQVTYSQLCDAADALAATLRPLLTGTRHVVVHLERSLEAVVAMLAVWRAGGVYVPLDPKDPAERTRRAMGDIAPCACIGAEGVAPMQGTVAASGDVSGSHIAPDDPAYVIFTSGTTGRPKGVIVPHRGLTACVSAQLWAFGSQPRRVLQFAPLTFDASIFEVWLALATGGTICVPEAEQRLPGAGLEEFIADAGITDVVLPNSVARALGDLASTRLAHVMLAGERVDPALVRRLASAHAVYNLYGPTEASVWCTGERVDGSPRVTVGGPILHSRVQILDDALQPLPVGCAGEICVSGPGVALGYLHQPGLTAERFVPDPISAEPGGRLYRTGDQGRVTPEGAIEAIGRRDRQVKLRGVRIELGEVEAALRDVDGIESAAVILRPDGAGAPRLLAYVVPVPGRHVDGESVRDALRTRLPATHLPNAVVPLTALPTRATGKLDESKLPDPASTGDAIATNEPAGEIETLAARCWGQVLNVAQIGAGDDLFQLGANSLNAAQVAARLSNVLGIRVSVDVVLQSATVRHLARELARLAVAPLPAIVANSRLERWPLTAAQQALWIARRRNGGSHVLFTGCALPREWSRDLIHLACAEIHARHASLRSCFVDAGGEPYQQLVPTADVPFAHHVLTADDGAEVMRIASDLSTTVFDPGEAPLYRVALVTPAEGDQLLLLAMHHLIADGWSIGVYLHEVRTRCAAMTNGRAAPFEPLPVHYGDYALWERNPANVSEQDLRYWDGLLEGWPGELSLASSEQRRATGSVETAKFSLDTADCDRLAELERERGATRYMVLLAALAVVLHSKSGRRDIVVCTDAAGRIRAELEPLIGLFLNQLLLRVRLENATTLADAIDAARAGCLASYRAQHVPFHRLVARHAHIRRPGLPPLAQIKLNLQPFPSDDTSISSADAPLGTTAADMDLTIFVSYSRTGLAGTLVYDPGVIAPELAAAAAADFVDVLGAMVETPEAPLDALVIGLNAQELSSCPRLA